MGYLKYQTQLSHIQVEWATEFIAYTYLKIRDSSNGSRARFKDGMVSVFVQITIVGLSIFNIKDVETVAASNTTLYSI